MTALISLKQIGQTSASLNDVVTWDGSAWVAGAISTASTFNDLTDAADYVVGDANKVVKVNSSGDGIDFGLVLGSAASQDESYFALASHSHSIANVTGLQTALDAKVDDGSITTSGLTQSSGMLLGRTTASPGAVEEITIGSGLTFSAGLLSLTPVTPFTPILETGTGSSQNITLPVSGLTANDLLVTFEGIIQDPADLSISGTTLTVTAPNTSSIVVRKLTGSDSGPPNETWDFNYAGNGDQYIRAREAMTITQQGVTGTGSVAYEKSTAASPDVFTSTTSPITLEAGAKLKVTASGVSATYAVHLERTA